ncbi:hypothetical protein AQS8620_02008 [Aquimixticola soesokkakensis]|uniref:YjiS-like domain-containing protein n=1 Tax=Aquimixticola soesokkakensis TaxID=1519096 RepID=A0A1Y5STI4_9RHOB|nr:DUF1127 domain-containing protein [Aquimixticola soesokkakensis]SLN48184.1 hypothetical protein AQS8620_02008 [Aquimixticola soesokkakensis]
MATLTSSAVSTPVANSAFAGLKRVAQKAIRALQAEKTIRMLNAMSDHELNDIGLSRGAISSVVRGTR